MRILLYHFLLLILIISFSCQKNKKQHSFSSAKQQEQEQVELVKLSGVWELVEVNDTLFSLSDFYGFEAKQPTLIIDKESGQISGFSGCNEYLGEAKFKDDRVEIPEPVIATEVGCEQNVWENEFFDRLMGVLTYEISDDTLRITRESSRALTFKKVANH